jgi:hypothetical protein
MNRKTLLPILISLGVFLVIFAVVALYLWNASRKDVPSNTVSQNVSTINELPELEVTDEPLSPTKQIIGGDLKVTGNVTIIDGLSSSSLQLIPVTNQSNLRTGQLYTTNDNALYYYNGQNASNISGGLSNAQADIVALQEETQRFLNQPEAVLTLQGQSGNVVLTGSAGITIAGTTISNNGVLTVQGRAGNIQFVSGEGIEVNGTTISNRGVTSIGGQNGIVSLGNGLSISNGTLVNTGITQLISGSADILLSDGGDGSYTISYAGSGVGGTVALAPNSTQQDSSDNASIAFNKTGLGNLIQISTGTNASNKFVVDQSGAILNGSINFSQVTGVPSLVNSISGLTGTVGLGTGLTVSGGQIVATTAVNNLVGTANQVNVTGSGTLTLSLPQNIATTSSPTFAGLTLTNALTVANGGTGATSAAGARTNLGAAASGSNSDITSLSGLTTALSVSQGGTGTNTLTQNGVLIGNGSSAISTVNATAANQCLVSDASGLVSFQSCPGAGGVTSLNGKSGGVTITGVDPTSIDSSGSNIVIRDASYTTKGLASFNNVNFAVLNGSVNTAQDINTGATPTFAGLILTDALTVANGGTGRTSFTTNGLLLGQGSGALGTVSTTTAGQCLISGTGGVLGFSTCPGATGVTSVNGLTGSVTLSTTAASSLSQLGNTITIRDASETIKGLASFNADNLVVTNGVVNTVQNISSSSTPTFAGLNLNSALSVASGGTGRTNLTANSLLIGNGTGAVSMLTAPSAGLCLASGVGGTLSFVTCPGAEVVNTINGQSGALTVTAVDPSSINTTGGTITIRDASYTTKGLASFNGSNFSVTNGAVNTVQDIGTTATPTFEGLSLTSALGVTSGGTGASSFAANSLLIGQGTAAVTTLGTTTEGQCLMSGTGGYLSFSACPGSNGVDSVNGLLGALTVRGVNASSVLSSGSTITIVNATDTVRGLAAFNSANLVVTNGIVNTIQDISINAAPTFAELTLTSPLAVSSGGTGASSFAANSVLIGNGGSALNTVSATAENQCLISGSDGTLSFVTCPGAGGVNSLNGLQGSLTLNAADPNSIASSGNTITLRDATNSRKGLASFDASNFTVVNGAVNLIQDIGTGATPTFAGLELGSALTVSNGGTGATDAIGARTNLGAAASGANTDITSLGSVTSITSSAGLSVASAGTLTLQGAATVLSQSNGVNSTQLIFENPTADVIYTLQTAAAGTYEVCTTAGNCVGVGGGVTTLGGTVGKLSRFVSGSAIGDSIITDDGTTVSIEGVLSVNNITPTAAAVIGATTQSLTLQGSTTSITSTGSVSTNTLTFATPSGANKTILIPNASGTIAISASGPLTLDANGNLSCASCLTSGGGGGGATGVSSVNGLTGDITIVSSDANSITTTGTTITVNDATSTRKGLASFNSTNLTVSNGVVNTIQNIGTDATPTFASINLTSPLTVSNGGTGRTNLPKGLMIGNGTSAVDILAPAGASECLASDSESNLVFVACPGTSVVNFINGINGTVTLDTVSANSLVMSGNNIRIQDATSAIKGLASFDGSNLTIVNGAVNTAQNITTSATPTFAGLNLSAALGVASGGTGRTSLTTNGVVVGQGTSAVTTVSTTTAGQCLVSGTGGALSFASCPGAGGVTSFNGLNGDVTLDTVTPSSLLMSGNNIRIQDATSTIKGLASFNADSLTVTNGNVSTVQSINTSATPTFAGLNLNAPLGVASGGTGRATLPSGSLLLGNGTGAVSSLGTSVAGKCLVSGTGGALSFLDCPGTDVVNSINGVSGAITVTAADPSSIDTTGGTITVRDASYITKGLASFNGGNFLVTNGSVNTIQDIASTSSPTFAGLTLSAALGVANGGTGTNTFAMNGILIGQGTSAISTVGTSTAGQCLVSGTGGVLSFASCPGSGGVSSVNGLTGAITLTATSASSLLTSGNTVTIRDASDTIKGLASFSADNLTVTGGVVDTIQDISTASTPTFAGLSLSNALSVANGGTGRSTLTANRVLLGNGTAGIAVSNEAAAGYCLIGNVSGAPTFQACPVGGNISAGTSQTPGVVTIFDTTTNQITDSIISQAGSVVSVGGQLSATTLAGNGAAITDLNASNIATGTVANARLSTSVTLQGNNFNGNNQLIRLDSAGATTANGLCLMSTGSGTGTAFQPCPGSGGEAGANAALSNLANVSINDMLLPGANNSIDLGSVTRAFRNLYLGGTVTVAGAINGLSLASNSVQSAGSLTLAAGGTNQAVTIAGSGSGGINLNAGTGALTLSGFSCSSSANGGKLTTNGSGAVTCADDIGGVSVVGIIDSQSANINGAVISGNTIYLQTASASAPGLVSTGAQTFSGNKTFASTTTLQGATNSTGTMNISGSLQIGSSSMGVLYTDTAGIVQKVATSGASVGQCLAYTGTNTLGFQSCGGGSANPFLQGGNAFNATAVLGVTDNHSFNIIQNNQNRIAMPNDGNIIITPSTNKFVFINTTASDSEAELIVNGRIKSLTGFRANGANGVTISQCGGYIQNAVVNMGIITGGSCSTGGAAGQAIVQGGNAFNQTLTMGTTDNNGINIIKGNATVIAISQAGDIDITPSTNRWLRVGTTNTDGEAQFIVNGRIKSLTGFRVNNSNGVSLTCGNGNQTLGAPRFEGGILVQASCSTNNSDLAENYSSTQDLAPAEIVMAAGTAATAVVRAEGAGAREKLMGVVSTAPAQTLGTEQVPEGYPIALTGRVPVKVNGEGGAINVGDKVTISSVAGVGKKATSAGMIVGTAVEYFNGAGQGSIEVFVNLMYWSPVGGDNLQAQSGIFGSLNVSGHTTLASLTVTGQARFVGNIVVEGHIITGGGAPNYATGAAAGAGGSVSVDGNDTAGTITITTGAGAAAGSLADLTFSQVYGKAPRVILSGQDDASLNARIFPAAKAANGFSLNTSQSLAPNTTYTFDYFIVE